MRRNTRQIVLGGIPIGGGAPITVQSMTKTDTRNISATVKQIHELERIGCDIIRVAVPDEQAAKALKGIKRQISIPLVADIHFDYRLALQAIENGADGIRINPGNIGSCERVRAVIKAASEKNIPIRIGVNMGSLDPKILAKYGRTAKGLVESALNYIDLFEQEKFYNIKISVKAADVMETIEAYRSLSEQIPYPLHVGITETGGLTTGTIKSAVGIGALLAEGIGDTIRVSLTGAPHEEVRVGQQILKSLGLQKKGIELISCPTCGRCQINLIEVVNAVEKLLPETDNSLRVAVMGCTVNGPGEAKDADVGIAIGKGYGLLFKNGKMICRVSEEKLVDTLVSEVKQILKERENPE